MASPSGLQVSLDSAADPAAVWVWREGDGECEYQKPCSSDVNAAKGEGHQRRAGRVPDNQSGQGPPSFRDDG